MWYRLTRSQTETQAELSNKNAWKLTLVKVKFHFSYYFYMNVLLLIILLWNSIGWLKMFMSVCLRWKASRQLGKRFYYLGRVSFLPWIWKMWHKVKPTSKSETLQSEFVMDNYSKPVSQSLHLLQSGLTLPLQWSVLTLPRNMVCELLLP